MDYTLCFLFNNDLSKVLLMRKNRSVYVGCLNGVGGKVEAKDLFPDNCAVREIKEETNVEIGDRLNWLVSCKYPSGVNLHVYYGVVDESEVEQVEDEILDWYKIDVLLNFNVGDSDFAGEGNLLYFIYASLCELQFRAL